MSQIAQIKDAVSIVEIIGEKIALTPSGHYHRGLCPFHGEKSPSFFVDDRIGHFRCFGCGEGGDVISFLEKYDNLTFREALEILAERTGIKLENKSFSAEDDLRAKALEALTTAAHYYQTLLHSPTHGKEATAYLKERGLYADTIKLFQIGVATSDWHGLSNHLTKQGFSKAVQVAAGLVIQKNTGSTFDRFRERLMFPLKNHRGQIVGFSGRLLKKDDKEAKYINSPETTLYHKSKMLYGLYENSQIIKKKNSIVIVEGEFDMLSSYQAHVDNVVAIKGSALTTDHAKIIARYCQLVYLALDSDNAGVKATAKAIEVLGKESLELKVIILPSGKDPDDFARAHPSEWRDLIGKAVSPYEYFLQVTVNKFALDQKPLSLDNKKLALAELAPLFGNITNLIEKEYYLKKLAKVVEEETALIAKELERLKSLDNASNVSSKPQPVVKPTTPKSQPTARQKLEMYIWFLFFQTFDDKKISDRIAFFHQELSWESPLAQKLHNYWQDYEKSLTDDYKLKDFIHSLPADYQTKVTDLCLNRVYTKQTLNLDLLEEWRRAIIKLQQLLIKKRLEAVNQELKLLDNNEDLTPAAETVQTKLLTEIVDLQKRLKTLK